MPDGGVGRRPWALHDVAVAEVEAWLHTMGSGVRRLEAAELRLYAGRAPVVGWRFPVHSAAGDIELDLIVSKEFPWAPPRVAFVGEPKLGRWPHAESDNVFCVADRAAFNPLDAKGAAAIVLNDAVELIKSSVAGANRDDFLAEFETYWTHITKTRAPPVFLLMRPGGATRTVRLWRDGVRTIVADDDETLERWIRNARFLAAGARFTSSAALAVSVALPPMPDDYPDNGAAIVEYLRREALDALPMLAGLSDPETAAIDIVLMAKSPDNRPVAAAMVLLRPQLQSRGPGRAPVDPMTRGFRTVLPYDVALSRYTGGTFRTATVERADRDWIHGRDADQAARRLAEASIVILGGGSLGAPSAWSLARSGVGECNVVDDQMLSFANVGRHPLGAPSVRENKALELVAEMKRTLPHLKGQGYAMKFQKFRDMHHDVLSRANLIVSVMGDWQAEGALNAWRLEQPIPPPILFGWAEEHACAGHAVAIVDKSACFACGMTPRGLQRFRVTSWSGPTLLKEPGCGAHFQPYGPIEISRIADTISELAVAVLLGEVNRPLHRIWAAPQETLKRVQGAWTPEWLQACDGRSEGGFLFSRPWGAGVCWQCGRAAA